MSRLAWASAAVVVIAFSAATSAAGRTIQNPYSPGTRSASVMTGPTMAEVIGSPGKRDGTGRAPARARSGLDAHGSQDELCT